MIPKGAPRPEDQLLRRALHGSAFFLFQRLAATLFTFLGNILLARLLFPQDFGARGLLALLALLLLLFL